MQVDRAIVPVGAAKTPIFLMAHKLAWQGSVTLKALRPQHGATACDISFRDNDIGIDPMPANRIIVNVIGKRRPLEHYGHYIALRKLFHQSSQHLLMP